MDPQPQLLDTILPFGGTIQYRIPAYQRRYGWNREQLHGLWRDVGELLRNPHAQGHFCGVLLKLDRPSEGAISSVREVIDGQQRLVTFLILLAALRDHQAEREGRDIDFDRDRLVHLVRPGENTPMQEQIIKCHDPDEHRRLHKVLHGDWRGMLAAKSADPIVDAYTYFRYCAWRGMQGLSEPESMLLPKVKDWTHAQEPEASWCCNFTDRRDEIDISLLERCIRKRITLLPLTVSDTDEDPILIFDAINGKRLEFSQWDHAKTLLFRRLGDVHELYRRWALAEENFKEAIKQKGRRRQNLESVAEGFLYDFVISMSASGDERPKIRRAAIQLRKLLQQDDRDPSSRDTERFIDQVFLPAATLYCSLVAPQIRPKDRNGVLVSRATMDSIEQIESFSANTARPMVLSALQWWHSGAITEELLLQVLRAIEAHHCRMLLIGEDFSPLRSRMMNLMIQVNEDSGGTPQSRARRICRLLNRDDLSDARIRARHQVPQAICDNMNKSRVQVAALLRGIECQLSGGAGHPLPHGRGDRKFEVEHIFPQACGTEFNKSWQDDLRRWKKRTPIEAFRDRMNVIGNLALIQGKANKNSSAKGFEKKQEVLRKDNPLLRHLEDVLEANRWLPEIIDARTTRLLEVALKQWPMSQIP
jgi:hypothetical protein